MSPALTTLLTVTSGVLVFVVGQLVQRFLLEPLQEQRKTVGEIAFNLIYLANLSHVKESIDRGYPIKHQMDAHEASTLLRKLGGQLRASLSTIPKYDWISRLGWAPVRQDVLTASQHMIGWSNSIFQGDPNVHRKAVATALKIKAES